MKSIGSKFERLKRELEVFKRGVPTERYWIDQRCLILLTHIYTEILVNKLITLNGFSESRAKNEGYKLKINKLKEKGILKKELYGELVRLNDARNAVGHNLNIIGELSNIDHYYLDMDKTKEKAVKLFDDLTLLLAVESL